MTGKQACQQTDWQTCQNFVFVFLFTQWERKNKCCAKVLWSDPSYGLLMTAFKTNSLSSSKVEIKVQRGTFGHCTTSIIGFCIYVSHKSIKVGVKILWSAVIRIQKLYTDSNADAMQNKLKVCTWSMLVFKYKWYTCRLPIYPEGFRRDRTYNNRQ